MFPLPLVLAHVLITLVAIGSGALLVRQMLRGGQSPSVAAVFLGFTALTSITGFVFFPPATFPPPHPTPAQLTGVIGLVVLIPTLIGLYGAKLAGRWRAVYVVGVMVSLYLNVFVLVVQAFLKLPPQPITGGPIFALVQGVVLVTFLILGRRALQRFQRI